MSLNDLVFPSGPCLSSAELNELINRAQQGDQAAREEAINANLRLVLSVAKRFVSFGYELEDLFQIGCFGLFKAVDRFDCQRGLMFSTYAVPLIIGEIRSFVRDDGPVKVSRGLKEQYLKLNSLRQQFLQENGAEPSPQELADLSGLSTEEVVVALDAANQPVSLNEVVYAADNQPVYREDTLAIKDHALEKAVNKVSLAKALSTLDPRERQILILRYLENYSQNQIATRFGISQVHVSRLLKKALNQAQKALES